jgi:hypothetical protein
MSSIDEDAAELLQWYRSLSPLRVDIVGDFAGKELFAIHGDSLMLDCITKSHVDYSCKLFVISLSNIPVQGKPQDHVNKGTRWIPTVACGIRSGKLSRQSKATWMQLPHNLVH